MPQYTWYLSAFNNRLTEPESSSTIQKSENYLIDVLVDVSPLRDPPI